MESSDKTKSIKVISAGSHSIGSISVHCYTPRERFRRAFRTTVVCLLLLVVAGCIPGAHFVLVPLLLLLSPFLVFRSWREKSVITSLQGRCAVCQGELTRTNTRENYPLFENCLACRRENRIEVADA